MIDTTHAVPDPRVAAVGDRDVHSDTPAMPSAVSRPRSDDELRAEASARVSRLSNNSDSIADVTWPSEAELRPAAAVPHPAARARSALLMAVIIAGAFAVALITIVAAPMMQGLIASAPARGQLTVLSDTPARVSIDGKDHGPTPIDVSLDAGPHSVRVSSGADADTMTVVITAGSREVHHVHAAVSPAPVADTGTLRITTPEAGARIVLDGEFRGLTPMSFSALTPGLHHIAVVTRGVTIRRDVTIEPQRTIDLELMPNAAAPAGSSVSGGWLVVSSPFEVEIWENGALIGSSRSARVMLSPGSHAIDVVSQLLGYRDHRTISVIAGQTTPLRLVAPQGTLSVNATPWADVWVDGTRVGETPIGEIPLTIGSHDVLLRHPELGERRVQSVVRVGEVTRVTQDLRQRGTRP